MFYIRVMVVKKKKKEYVNVIETFPEEVTNAYSCTLEFRYELLKMIKEGR